MSTAEAFDEYGFDNPLTTELYEDGLDEDEESLAQGSASDLSISSQYHKEIQKIPLLDPITTTRLAELVERGANAQDVMEFLEFAEIPIEGEVEQIKAIADAKEPVVEMLVHYNLRFAADVARRSMGWLPKGMDRSHPEARQRLSGARIRDLSRLAAYPLPYLDRVQAANQGLRRAAERYRPGYGAMFTTYAMHWVETAIERAVQEDRSIRIPPHILPKLNEAEKILAEPRDNPEARGGAYWEGFERRDEARHLLSVASVVSLDSLLEDSQAEQPTGDEDHEPNLYETIDARENLPLEDDPEEQADQAILQQKIAAALEGLPDRDKLILEHRYDFIDGKTFTLEEIGMMLDVTRERVRQLENNALRKMQHQLMGVVEEYGQLPKVRQIFAEKKLKFIDDKLYLVKLHAIRLAFGRAAVNGAPSPDLPTKEEVMFQHNLYAISKALYTRNPEAMAALELGTKEDNIDKPDGPLSLEDRIIFLMERVCGPEFYGHKALKLAADYLHKNPPVTWKPANINLMLSGAFIEARRALSPPEQFRFTPPVSATDSDEVVIYPRAS